jgi:hypothetical protein
MTEHAKYGRRNVPKMIREWDALRQTIRSDGSPSIQSALDQVEEHIDYAYRADLSQPAQVLEICGKCAGSGYGGHPDGGHLCADCSGSGGVPQPDPRDEVIARLVEAVENLLRNYLQDELDEPDLCVDDDHWAAIHDVDAALAAAKAVLK